MVVTTVISQRMQYYTIRIVITKTICIKDINILHRIDQDQFDDNDNHQSDSEVDVILNNTVLYNAMIHPLTRMVIKGIIWYQGIW
jgi:hypothetical protein